MRNNYHMNKTLHAVFHCLWMFLFTLSGSQALAETGGSRSVTIHPDLLPQMDYHAELGGVNTNFFRSFEDWSDPRLWQAMRDAGIRMIRFPGGLANWYQWHDGSIDTTGQHVFPFMKQGKNTSVPLLPVIHLAKQYHIQICYVVNIMQSEAEIEALSAFWVKHNAPVAWVEFGNEYFHPKFSADIGGLKGYIAASRKALAALRRGGYRGKSSLSVAPARVWGRRDRKDFIAWNRELSHADIHQFDALNIHYYLPFDENNFSRTYEKGTDHFRTVIRRLRTLFPGKELWVTEWNLARPAKSSVFNTMQHAQWVLHMLTTFHEMKIDIAAYHLFNGRGWELWSWKRGERRLQKPSTIRRIPYFTFSMYNKASKHASKLAIYRERSLEGIIFWQHNHLMLLLSNTANTGVHIKVKYKGRDLSLSQAATLVAMPMQRNGSLLSREPEEEHYIPRTTHTMALSAYGFGLFEFNIQP